MFRIPHYNNEILVQWYDSNQSHNLYQLYNFFIQRVQYGVRILQKSNIINKTWYLYKIFIFICFSINIYKFIYMFIYLFF